MSCAVELSRGGSWRGRRSSPELPRSRRKPRASEPRGSRRCRCVPCIPWPSSRGYSDLQDQRGTEESNLERRFWRPPCCRYTSPPAAFSLVGGRLRLRTDELVKDPHRFLPVNSDLLRTGASPANAEHVQALAVQAFYVLRQVREVVPGTEIAAVVGMRPRRKASRSCATSRSCVSMDGQTYNRLHAGVLESRHTGQA